MAIAPTGAAYKSLTFDNKTSREFGVYITGEAVYNAPEREVEMITIPGRDGAFALDKGRFENIPVKYPAGIFADREGNFREAISAFRNFLCSKRGYCRLTDEYNPDEFRKAVYKSGLEVDKVRDIAAEFEILFDAMPQRWLTSGETKQTIAASGDTISNPTLFSSKPLLEVEGYGNISFNGYDINISNATMGNVQIVDREAMGLESYTVTDPSGPITAVHKSAAIPVDAYANIGDDFTATVDIKLQMHILLAQSISAASITTQPSNANASVSRSGVHLTLNIKGATLSGTIGTDATSTDSCVVSATYKAIMPPYNTYTATSTVSVTLAYDSSTNEITATVSSTGVTLHWESGDAQDILSFMVDSTVSILGTPTYIDCDLGTAYRAESGTVVSLNAYIDLGSELPVLAAGSNAITFDNTITSLKITPRWWKI